MGRIVVQVELTNPIDPEKSITFSAFVDTGAGALILPSSWKSRLGEFTSEKNVEFLLTNNDVVFGVACGPLVFV